MNGLTKRSIPIPRVNGLLPFLVEWLMGRPWEVAAHRTPDRRPGAGQAGGYGVGVAYLILSAYF